VADAHHAEVQVEQLLAGGFSGWQGSPP
jgi:hypothetical protein